MLIFPVTCHSQHIPTTPTFHSWEMDNDISIVANPIVVNADLDNDENSGTRENETTSDQNDQSPQLLPPSPHPDPREDESSREVKRWHQTLPLLSQIIKDRNQNSTTKDNTAIGISRSMIAHKLIAIKWSLPCKAMNRCPWNLGKLSVHCAKSSRKLSSSCWWNIVS